MSDEEIIRRRLMIDGDGTGDDRRLNMFLKSFNKWAAAEDISEGESDATYERQMSQLSQCELSLQKTSQGCRMNEAELQHYELLYEQVDSSTDAVREQIEDAQGQLEAAKQVRRNRMEYDALARLIERHPDRRQTERKLAGLKSELESLERCQEALDSKLETRRKQFHALLTCVHQLQQTLDEDAVPLEGTAHPVTADGDSNR